MPGSGGWLADATAVCRNPRAGRVDVWEGRAQVLTAQGEGFSEAFLDGARQAWRWYSVTISHVAVLKANSPSCGNLLTLCWYLHRREGHRRRRDGGLAQAPWDCWCSVSWNCRSGSGLASLKARHRSTCGSRLARESAVSVTRCSKPSHRIHKASPLPLTESFIRPFHRLCSHHPEPLLRAAPPTRYRPSLVAGPCPGWP